MQKLLNLLTELESKIPDHGKVNTNISASNVGWHIQHTTLVLVRITDAIKQSDPSTYKYKFNWRRTLVYTINSIPRGKIKAPKTVQPAETFTVADLQSGIEKAKSRVNELTSLSRKQYLAHPFLGDLKLKHAIKFLELHTRHHLKIIEDITR